MNPYWLLFIVPVSVMVGVFGAYYANTYAEPPPRWIPDGPDDQPSPFEVGLASYWRARGRGTTESHSIELALSDTLDAVTAGQSPAPFHSQLS